MHLSKRSNGIYYLWYETDLGARRKVSTGSTNKSDALKFLQSFQQEQHENRVKLQRTSLVQFAEDYLTYSKGKHKDTTQNSLKTALREFIRVVQDRPLQTIGIRDIENFLAVKKAEASSWTARKYYLALAAAFETAKRWNCINKNPFRQVQKPKTPQLQPLFMSKAEFQVLLDVIGDGVFHDLCVIGFHTGLRMGELQNLKWDDIDLLKNIVQVRNSDTFTTKSGKNRVVPLNRTAIKVFNCRQNGMTSESPLVFHRNGRPFARYYIAHKFKKYVRRAGLNDKLHFHSLRHSFASNLVQAGISLYEVQRFLGHSNISVTQVYAHLQPQQLHHSVQTLDVSLN